jgi:hypothetical protein
VRAPQRQLRQLSDKIRRLEQELARIRGSLRREKRRESVLTHMLEVAQDKVRSILKVKDHHKQKVADLLDAVEKLERQIAAAKAERDKLEAAGGGGDDAGGYETHTRSLSTLTSRDMTEGRGVGGGGGKGRKNNRSLSGSEEGSRTQFLGEGSGQRED